MRNDLELSPWVTVWHGLLNMKSYIAPFQRLLLRIAPEHSTAVKEIS